MAIVKKGTLLDGLSGRVGDLVCRTRGDRTIVSIRPGQRNEPERSAARERTITRFQAAVEFAREARHKPAFRSLSRMLRGFSPYHVALQDYLSEPVIEAIDASRVGPAGGELRIAVSEKIAIRSVRVMMPAVESTGPLPEPEIPAPAELLSTPEQRVPIPAALFFRKSAPELPAPPIAREDDVPPPEPGDPRKFQAQATRIGTSKPGEPLRETWGIRLPRGGEVEVIASDYAGNRVSARVRVGMGSAPTDATPPESH